MTNSAQPQLRVSPFTIHQSVILSDGWSVSRAKPESKDPEEVRTAPTLRTFLPQIRVPSRSEPSSSTNPNSVILSEGSRSLSARAAVEGPAVALAVIFLWLTLFTLPTQAQKTTPKISGAATYELTKQLLAVAPKRTVGTPGHLAAEQFIKSHFAPEAAKGNFETDQFTSSTPAGMQTMRNYIVRYPGKKDGIIVLASHYETNYPLKDINFVGANDGAATSALLISLGEYFRTHPPEGYSIWLVFDDGEEAVQSWSDTDSLYGTRHLAAKWSREGILPKIKAFIVADMIADKDLNIDHEGNSTPELESILQQAARNTGHSSHVFKESYPGIQDDHLPFKARGVPVLDMIDIDYGPRTAAAPDGWHHTAEDTLDKISAQSLQISADLFLEVIHLINQH